MESREIRNQFRLATTNIRAGNVNKKGYITLEMSHVSRVIFNFCLEDKDCSHMRQIRVSPSLIRRARYLPPTC